MVDGWGMTCETNCAVRIRCSVTLRIWSGSRGRPGGSAAGDDGPRVQHTSVEQSVVPAPRKGGRTARATGRLLGPTRAGPAACRTTGAATRPAGLDLATRAASSIPAHLPRRTAETETCATQGSAPHLKDICRFWCERGVEGSDGPSLLILHDPELRDKSPASPEVEGAAWRARRAASTGEAGPCARLPAGGRRAFMKEVRDWAWA